MANVILIVGGSRSGKSRYALELSEAAGDRRLFVATCPNVDDEMDERVRKHQLERVNRDWHTVEEQIDLSGTIEQYGADFDVILIDCLTLWINNLMFREDGLAHLFDEKQIENNCRSWLEKANDFAGTLVCVSNEIGMGIVPDNALARKYRDLVGTCNQTVAEVANQVVMVSCGLPLNLKK